MTNYHQTKYALLGMLLFASSCSQEAPDNGDQRHPGGRIEFRVALPEVSSRATEVTAATLSDFQVRAFTVTSSSVTPYFPDKTFSRDRNTGTYICYDEKCIWPNNNDVIRFLAFYPSADIMLKSGDETPQEYESLKGISVSRDIASQFDFVAAVGSGCLLDNEETEVELKFHHQLSRIRLNAWSASKSYDLEIAGARLGGIATTGDFIFTPAADAAEVGSWANLAKGDVAYIFRPGDQIVRLDGSDNSPVTAGQAVSILGAKIGEDAAYDNSAMIIPSRNSRWEYKDNPSNGDDHSDGMFISVLLRVIDDTPFATQGDIVYPYTDDTDDKVYLAVDSEDRLTVRTRVYPLGDDYYTDAAHTTKYDLTGTEEIKAFAWAALPVEDDLKPGRVYTYTLNYTNGVGLRAPDDTDPGTSIISDRVLINVDVAEWIENDEDKTGVTVPRK